MCRIQIDVLKSHTLVVQSCQAFEQPSQLRAPISLPVPYLIIGQEASSLSVLPSLTLPGWLVQASGVGIPGEGEGLAVERHPHNQLLAACPLLYPVVDGKVL